MDDMPDVPPDLFEGDKPLKLAKPDDKLQNPNNFDLKALNKYLLAELLLPHGVK